MTTTAHAGRMLSVTLPVADVPRTTEFFAKLGFTFNPAFSDDDDDVSCMLVGEQAIIMFGSHEAFAQHSHRPMADPTTHALALFSFSVAERGEVDTVADAVLAQGATQADGPEDHGFMYTRSFFDLDGHGWQVMWMDPAVAGLDGSGPAAQEAGAPA